MVLSLHRERLGAAVYRPASAQVRFCADVQCPDAEHFQQLVEELLAQEAPTSLVLSAKTDETLIARVQAAVEANTGGNIDAPGSGGAAGTNNGNGNSSAVPPAIDVALAGSREFRIDAAMRRILCAHVHCWPSDPEQRRQTLGSSIDPGDEAALIAIGVLLGHIERLRIGVELEPSDVPVPVVAVLPFSL